MEERVNQILEQIAKENGFEDHAEYETLTKHVYAQLTPG